MAVVIPEILDVIAIEIEPKLSDQVIALPLDLFGPGHLNNPTNATMCGMGIIRALTGDTLLSHTSLISCSWAVTPRAELREVLRAAEVQFSASEFDVAYLRDGPEAAKQLLVEWLRKRGL